MNRISIHLHPSISGIGSNLSVMLKTRTWSRKEYRMDSTPFQVCHVSLDLAGFEERKKPSFGRSIYLPTGPYLPQRDFFARWKGNKEAGKGRTAMDNGEYTIKSFENDDQHTRYPPTFVRRKSDFLPTIDTNQETIINIIDKEKIIGAQENE